MFVYSVSSCDKNQYAITLKSDILIFEEEVGGNFLLFVKLKAGFGVVDKTVLIAV